MVPLVKINESETHFLRGNNGSIIFLLMLIAFGFTRVPGYGQVKSESNEIALSLNKKLESDKFEKQINKKSLNKKDWFYTGLEINYIMLNALDLVTTFNGLKHGAKEMNPVAKLYINNKPVALVIKTGLTALTLHGLSHVRKENKKAAYISLGLLNVIYGFVVQNNIAVYLQLKS